MNRLALLTQNWWGSVTRDAATEEGMTMVVVTHEMQFAREVANRVIFLGRVAEEGIARQVITNPTSDRLRAFLSRE